MAYPKSVGFSIGILLCFTVSLLNYSEARIAPSVEEYREMKAYLESMTRPSVKTMMDGAGHLFDCVDIHKQPAFDHPVLKSHVIQMEPLSSPPGMKNEAPDLLDEGCPFGTVPMKRIQMEDLIRAGSLSNFMMGGKQLHQAKAPHEYAYIRMTGGGPYYGTSLWINVWQPTINTRRGEIFSLAQLWISRGPSSELNTIEVGWQVYPRFYNDDKAHLFIFWTSNGYKGKGCYNLLCPGFVQVSRTITPGMALPSSVSGGNQVDIHLIVKKDKQSGNWSLSYQQGSDPAVKVGYWPSSIFTHLKDNGAERLTWGGEVTLQRLGTYPPMGSGALPSQGYGKAAYMRNIQYVDSNYAQAHLPNIANLIKGETKPNCYKLEDKGYNATWGRNLYFGGPGGTVCNALVTNESEEMATVDVALQQI